MSIAASELYGGLTLTPQAGLVPLGPDPTSGLWEFWHVESGARPERRDETAALDTSDRLMGIVLVLLPGGTFWMGSQADDPRTRNFTPYYRHRKQTEPMLVSLEPFFLSKYELTVQQWDLCDRAIETPRERYALGNLRRRWGGIQVNSPGSPSAPVRILVGARRSTPRHRSHSADGSTVGVRLSGRDVHGMVDRRGVGIGLPLRSRSP